MSSPKNPNSFYPKINQTNPETVFSSSSSTMYPPVDRMNDLADNLFPETDPNVKQTLDSHSSEEILITVPGAIIHLIDKQQSVELATGDFVVVRLKQGENVIAVLARVSDEIQWPLAKDEAVVKLDESHYFFTLSIPASGGDDDDGAGAGDEVLSYGLTIASKGQDDLLKELDKVLESYSSFSVKVVEKDLGELSGSVARETTPEEMGSERRKLEMIERSAEAYWTTLAPNVEDYSSCFARIIAAGSGHVIRGILWCGDVTVDRLKWGDEFLKKRMAPGSVSEISPAAMRRMKRVKKMTKMCEKMAIGVLSGVVKVTGFFTSPIVNSKVGKKFFSLLPGEIILASLDGFNKVCDAVEVAGRNVMSTSSVVTTGVIAHRYGDDAGSITNVGFDAAGHAIGTAWAVFKIRKAFNLKGAFKPTTIVKKAAAAKAAEKKAIEK